jgi:hypothetical protein
MPIQTGGFQVTAAPRYTPYNPGLVAFNPTAISDGAMTTFQMQRMMDEIKAKRAMMEELEATRAKRIHAQNVGADASVARDLSAINMIPTEDAFKTARFKTETDLIPKRGNLESLTLAESATSLPFVAEATRDTAKLTSAEKRGRLANVDLFTRADAQEALAREAEAAGRVDLAESKTTVAKAEIDKVLRDLDEAAQLAPDAFRVKQGALRDAIIHAPSDLARKHALENARIALMEAQTDQASAHADLYRTGPTSRETDPVLTEQRFQSMEDRLISRQKTLMETPVQNPDGTGKVPLSVYLSTTRGGGGVTDPVAKEGWFWKTPKKINTEGETFAKQLLDAKTELEDVQRRKYNFLNGLTGGNPGSIATPQAQPAPAPAGATKPGTRKQVLQNGKQYTLEWDGTKWVQAK